MAEQLLKKPKRAYKPLVVVVYIFDVKTDKQDNRIVKTIDSPERRDWLQSTIVWATMNGKYVTVINEAEDKE